VWVELHPRSGNQRQEFDHEAHEEEEYFFQIRCPCCPVFVAFATFMVRKFFIE
jgi:hypothetical protein